MTGPLTVARVLAGGALACVVAIPLAAQDTVRVGGGPVTSVARRAVNFFNAPTTTRIFGRLTIGPDDVYPGDVAVLDGPLLLEGAIEGDLVAINADVQLLTGSEVTGDVLVVGGSLARARGAEVRGTTRHHRLGIAVRRQRDRLTLVSDRREPDDEPFYRYPRFRTYGGRGDASLVLTTLGTYNRVEGLPIALGPRFRWGHVVGGEILALGIVRTAGDFEAEREDVGYSVNGFLRVGRWRDAPLLQVGVKAYDVVAPVEDWQFEDDEIGLAAFFLHRDYRDYYLLRGVAGYAAVEPVRGVRFSGEIARDDEESVRERDPWTLFRNSELWRVNPRIDDGVFTHFRARLELNWTEPGRYASTRWMLRAEWERGQVERDFIPRALPLSVRGPLPADYSYDRVMLDLRTYIRMGRRGQLRLRALGAGAVGDQPLPVQRRLSLGGPDPMPGYAFRRFNCASPFGDPARTALCDRIVLFQAEYRAGLFFGVFDEVFDWHADRGPRFARAETGTRDRARWWGWHDWFWFDGPQVVVLADAGTGWLHGTDPGDLSFDVGAGFTFGSVGFYAAKALEEDEPLRWLVRIHARF